MVLDGGGQESNWKKIGTRECKGHITEAHGLESGREESEDMGEEMENEN